MNAFRVQRHLFATIGLIAGLLGVPIVPAIAEEVSVIEEVIVTATRREEDVQDVAIPITAVTGDMLDKRFAQDLRDLTNMSPNVQLEPIHIFQTAASFYIRGQGQQDIESTADPKVMVLVDGIVQPRTSTALSDMLDVRSVEILRGPQGTLFGRNTIAGAVQVLHNEPEFNEWGSRLSFQAGDFGRADAKAVFNIPMVDDVFAGRLAYKYTSHDGYWDNDFVNEDRGASERHTLLPSLKWTPNDNWSVVLRGEWNKTRDDTNMTQSHHYCRNDPGNLFTGGPLDNDLVILTETLHALIVRGETPEQAAASARAICAVPFDSDKVDREFTAPNTEDRGQKYDTDTWGLTWEVDYDIPDIGTFTYLGGYREVEEDIIFTIDVSRHDLFAGRRRQEHTVDQHEIRFASNFSDRFDFVAGGFYFEQEYFMKQSSWGLLFAPNIILNPPDPNTLVFTHPSTYGQAQFSNQINEAWAVFGQANWHITDQLTLTVGGRYTDETKEFFHCPVGSGDESRDWRDAKRSRGCTNVPLFAIDPTLPPIVPPAAGPGPHTPVWQLTPAIGFDAGGGAAGGCIPVLDPSGAPILCNNRLVPPKGSWDDFTPMASLRYRFNDNLMAYFTFAEGFSSGGFAGRGTLTSIGPFDPETAENFEIGVKSDWFDGRLRANVTAFSNKVKGFQTAFIRPAPGGGGQETVTANLGSLKTEGFEAELTAIPTEGLTVWLNVSHLDTTRKGFCADPDGLQPGDPNVVPTAGGPNDPALDVCGPAEQVLDPIGNFLGWVVPQDLNDLNPTSRSPKWTTSVGFAYDWQIQNVGNVIFSLDWLYQGKQTIAGSRTTELDGVVQYNGDVISHFRKATDIFNGSVTWTSPEQRYQASFFVKNITNELYVQAVTNVSGLLNFRTPNLRRHWALELRMNLGEI